MTAAASSAADEAPSNPLFGPDSPIMDPDAFHRAVQCADIAIPLIAAGGCRAVSAGVLARELGVTQAAALKWFGSTAQMWETLAEVIGPRWTRCLDRSDRLSTDSMTAPYWNQLDVFQSLSLFLPLDEHEIEWTRVWLSMLELGRHQELVGSRVARTEAYEREVLYRATNCRDVPSLDSTLVLVRGLRHMVCATHEPLALTTAHDLLHVHAHRTYVEHGIPEPVRDEDVLPSSTRYTYYRPV